jgi:poly-gamma-glutamate synthesis protein (capsule biosynthesis protein)
MKIALLGDIAPFGRYCITRNEGLLKYFSPVADYLSQFDLVIGNLETPFVTNERPIGGKSATIKADPDNVALLSALGISHVTLANNHIGDFGQRAYERTKAVLEEAGIGWFGTEGKQIKLQQSREKIALLGYCSYNTNPSTVTAQSGAGLNYLDVEDVCRMLEENTAEGYLSILAIHSGQEHVHLPSSDDVAFARGLARNYDYVYYGHHPHVIQGHEIIGSSAIFYSLGNFVFDDVFTSRDQHEPLIRLSEANRTGAIATVEISDGHVVGSAMTPVYMAPDRMLIGEEVHWAEIESFDAYLADACTPEYDRRRSSIIADFIKNRRELRNLNWYLRRLNLNSFGIILKARKNSRLYRVAFSSKLKFLRGRP